MTSRGRVCCALAALAAWAAPALAQCPDGTPPPCGRGTAPTARRANPPLDERTWIVLPFENVARVAEIDWLKDASVNLLYLDMSKWSDIRVIDDERVADLIREEPRPSSGLTLQTGIAVAKRAGAGNLVMGDLLKIGSRTQLVGKVFDVRTGQRVRTVQQDAANADSIMPAFASLARRMLSVNPPAGTGVVGVGTSSVGAYQAYIAGVGFMNRWILDSARVQFTRAIQLDSAFALAHYKLSIVHGWESPNSGAAARHADLALRLGGNLPPRERNLVKGHAAHEATRYDDACALFTAMVQQDSTDVEAWYNLGDCSYHDRAVVRLRSDTTQFVFRGNWNVMLRAFRKTLELDPTYHLAFQHIQDALLQTTRTGCLVVPNADPCADRYALYHAYLRRAGDTLSLIPLQVDDVGHVAEQAEAARREGARARNLAEAMRAAEEWVATGPTETRPRIALARILLKQGNVVRADTMMRSLAGDARLTRPEAANALTDRVEIAVKRGRFAEGARLADSLFAALDSVPGARQVGVIARSVFGKAAALRPTIESALAGPTPDWVRRYYGLQARAALGAPADSVFDAESLFARNYSAGGSVSRVAVALTTSLLLLDPRLRGSRWPISDTASADPRIKLVAFLARGDTARFKVELQRVDSLVARSRSEPDNGLSLSLAQFRLIVGDTGAAIATLRSFQESTWNLTSMMDPVGAGFVRNGMLWPRTFLLLGDLEDATGNRVRAAAAYRIVLGFWQDADAEFQPTVRRVRDALQRLGGG